MLCQLSYWPTLSLMYHRQNGHWPGDQEPAYNHRVKKRGKVVVALFVVVILAAIGNTQIGGETWPEAMAETHAWRAYVPPFAPQPPEAAPWVVPLALVLGVIVTAVALWFMRRRLMHTSTPSGEPDKPRN